MRNWLTAGFASLGLIGTASIAAQTGQPDEELETVLVVGEQPGPGLWKVSKDGNVMWVLGTYGSLPKDMHWRSQRVEALIAESREVLIPGKINIGVGISRFSGFDSRGVLMNPGDATLQEVLPPEIHAKWLVLRARYFGSNERIERARPAIAAGALRTAATQQTGLVDTDIKSVVVAAAKQHGVKIRQLRDVRDRVRVKKPRSGATPVSADEVACFDGYLDRLDADVEAMKRRANAWAVGDMDALIREQQVHSDERDGCLDMLLLAHTSGLGDNPAAARKAMDAMKKEAEQAMRQQERDWIKAAKDALKKHPRSFAVADIWFLVASNGYLARLVEQGYTVEQP